MTERPDELKRLAAALRAATPEPDAQARARALEAAMKAFDAQGKAQAVRQTKRRPHWVARIFGGLNMPTLSLRPALLGGTSLAVIALAVVLVQNPEFYRNRPAPAPERLETPVAEPKPAETPATRVAPAATPADESAADMPAPGQLRLRVDSEVELDPARLLAERPKAAPPLARVLPQTERAEAPPAPAPLARMLPARPDAGAELSPPAENRDRFESAPDNPLKVTAEEPVSTFSIDVDTASYAWVRRALNEGRMPEPEAVRIEELINYFPYAYPRPESREVPFSTSVSLMPTPWNPGTMLMQIGIQGYDLAPAERPDANLVFLIDTSGSMDAPDKLPLLLNAFRLLLGELRPTDQVAIVAYAGSAGVVLEPTPASEKAKILAALSRLHAGGGTAGGEGILAAYALAEAMKAEGETTRVILATDGDFNIGVSDPEALTRLIAEKRDSGVFLSVLGFGEGNYNDALMQRLAQNGNGQAAYIDTLGEARKVLVEGVAGSLFPIAKDVKIQVEFNPATVAEYRLIGYETRALRREDFANDAVDAGEIGAGHSVTAIYEITPVDSPARLTEDLRYAPSAQTTTPGDTGDELAFVKLRYKLPDESESRLITRPVTPADRSDSTEARFAAAVAGFGELLKHSPYTGDLGYADIRRLARDALGEDPYGYRAEFLGLVRLAETLSGLDRR
ncbi:MAG: VWA domain-containing protein [Alphaproteobacteria bacterium]|nr:MAG: VWA domain-containing protein [Alphaproteobacteria bacterium]